MKARGVTLLEVLVGVVLLTLVLLPGLYVLSTGVQSVTETRDHLQAIFLGRQVLDYAGTVDFSRLALFQQATEAGKRLTVEWDLTHDGEGGPERIPVESRFGGIGYRIGEVAYAGVWRRSDPEHKEDPALVLLRFAVGYRGPDGKEHRHGFQGSFSRRE